jgi:hypothetical protein
LRPPGFIQGRARPVPVSWGWGMRRDVQYSSEDIGGAPARCVGLPRQASPLHYPAGLQDRKRSGMRTLLAFTTAAAVMAFISISSPALAEQAAKQCQDAGAHIKNEPQAPRVKQDSVSCVPTARRSFVRRISAATASVSRKARDRVKRRWFARRPRLPMVTPVDTGAFWW